MGSNKKELGLRRCVAMIVCLLLSSAMLSQLVKADMTAADYYVHSLPGAPEPLLKMHAGHIEVVPEHHGNLFFWHFQNRHIANRQRTVLWLNGGPGCSSLDGALMEIGPYRVTKDQKLEYNDGAWDEFANVLFVDNPVGTGFSYVDTDSYVHELGDMAKQMVTFLEKFFTLFPEYSADDLYIAGESYAGQHIPYIARAILDRNVNNAQPWNLSGLLIGNGWISGKEQYLSYLQYAYKEDVLTRGSLEAQKVEQQQVACIKELDKATEDHVNVGSCELILSEILRQARSTPRFHNKCVNMYDIRLTDEYPSCGMAWPPDLEQIRPYLRRADVTKALHINPDKKTGWVECNDQVGSAFSARNSKPSKDLLPGLLEQLPIVLFSGDRDLICNHIGTEDIINSLEWNGGKGMEMTPGVQAPRRDWTFEDEAAGTWQEARNLTYVLFYNSSHMVPFDYPRRTRNMLDRFMDVDIASIGGKPADSRLDGEKGLETSVGGHPNSTAAEEAEQQALEEATWAAYYKSGEVALVVVVIAVVVWGYFIWRARRRHSGYRGVFGADPHDGPPNGGMGLGLDTFRKSNRGRDVEAADFDEAELDDLGAGRHDPSHFDLGDDSDDDAGYRDGHANGHK